MNAGGFVVESALGVLEQSKTCAQTNRRLLVETRHRIAASWRRLNPAFAVAGSSDDETHALVASVRARLASGALFRVGSHVIAGNGSGNDCVVCHAPIKRQEVEYEIDLGNRIAVVAHLRCYVVWRDESVRLAQPRSA